MQHELRVRLWVNAPRSPVGRGLPLPLAQEAQSPSVNSKQDVRVLFPSTLDNIIGVPDQSKLNRR
jgi:hypothetical protein